MCFRRQACDKLLISKTKHNLNISEKPVGKYMLQTEYLGIKFHLWLGTQKEWTLCVPQQVSHENYISTEGDFDPNMPQNENCNENEGFLED